MADEPCDVEMLEKALASGEAGLLKRLDYGAIAIPSGRLIVDDPGTYDGRRVPVSVPPGTYPVFAVLNENTWAYAAIVLGDAEPVSWRRLGSLSVDSGAACFMSTEASERFLAWRPPGDLMKELWEPFHAAIRPPVKDQVRPPMKPFLLRVDDDPSHAIPIFSANGDGLFPFFLGVDHAGIPCRFVLDYEYGARDQHDEDDDEDDKPPLPRLPPEDAGFLALGVDEVDDAPEADTPAMARARERHEAGHKHVNLSEHRAGLACYFEAVRILRGTTVPYPELLYDIALWYRDQGNDGGRPFAEAAAVRFERRARNKRGRAEALYQLARAYAFLDRKPAMIQALKESSTLRPDNAQKVKNDPAFRDYVDDREVLALAALARRGRR